MWVCLNDAFFSIVRPSYLEPGVLLVRARRAGDIERVWPDATVERTAGRDYLYRARIPEKDVGAAISAQISAIDYDNFKDSVKDHALHDAYFKVWHAMAGLQNPAPYREE